MTFHDTYLVKPGDNLTEIGKQYGYPNPGPIVAYPPNASRFHSGSPDLIHPTEKFLIPWQPSLLQKYIAACGHLIDEIAEGATRLINEQIHNKEECEEFLRKIDAINFLAAAHVHLGSLLVQGMRGVEMSSKGILLWLADYTAEQGVHLAHLAIPAPDAPKRDFRFLVRHTLGPWTPSYWISVGMAIFVAKDIDVYLYGSDAVTYKTSVRIKQQAEAEIARLYPRIAEAETQLNQSFYGHRI